MITGLAIESLFALALIYCMTHVCGTCLQSQAMRVGLVSGPFAFAQEQTHSTCLVCCSKLATPRSKERVVCSCLSSKGLQILGIRAHTVTAPTPVTHALFWVSGVHKLPMLLLIFELPLPLNTVGQWSAHLIF